jgi:hypothetical protein
MPPVIVCRTAALRKQSVMRRYVAIAAGTALIAVVLSVTGPLPAFAQGALKPLMALIVNDASNPVPVLVTNATATQQPKRYGPIEVMTVHQGYTVLVPTVPAGSTFITSHLSAYGSSNISGDLTRAICILFIATGESHASAGAFPLIPNSGDFVGSQQMFLPLSAGERLEMVCSANQTASFYTTVAGYFVAAVP